MPLQMLLCWPLPGVCRQCDFHVLHAGEQKGRITCLGKMSLGYEDGVVVAQRPKAVVEEPVGILGQGDAVVQVVVAAVSELVDMTGIHDGAGRKRDEAIAGQGAGVIVGRDDADPEPPFPAALHCFLVSGLNIETRDLGLLRILPRQCPKGGLFVRLEIAADEDGPSLCPQSGVVDGRKKFGIEAQ